jgi:hypothetical protein
VLERELGRQASVVSQAEPGPGRPGRLLPGATRPAAGELRVPALRGLPLLPASSRFPEQGARCREGAEGQQAVSDGRDDAGCLVWRQLGAVEVHAADPGQLLGEDLGRGRPGRFRSADGDIGRRLYPDALADGGVPEFQRPGAMPFASSPARCPARISSARSSATRPSITNALAVAITPSESGSSARSGRALSNASSVRDRRHCSGGTDWLSTQATVNARVPQGHGARDDIRRRKRWGTTHQ